MQFSLEAAKVRLMHKNERLEKHGEDEVLACDLDFDYETSNAVLAEFHPELRSSVYKRPDDAQGELQEDPEHLTALRIPELGGHRKSEWSIPKAELVFLKGTRKHLVFAEARIHKISFDCKEGGTVVVHFQAQVHPDEAQSGKLSGLLQEKHCLVSLSPAEPDRPLDA
jgi:hypothetical protein